MPTASKIIGVAWPEFNFIFLQMNAVNIDKKAMFILVITLPHDVGAKQ
ncbi:hypothetical protein [Granulicella sp. L60]|nr:hypothetical protein [Granulicella sp. L60]